MSRVDELDWEMWAAADQDEAEREMLRRTAPPWVLLPPGAELAAALEPVRPQYETPVALIELMKAATRMEAWAASIKSAAIASFWRQRKAQARDLPRPHGLDSSGRPIDPERSWTAEIAAALKLSHPTAARHIDTALHLTGTLSATHTALRCGALTWSKALAISEATRPLPDTAAQAVEAHVLRRAPGQTHRNLRESLRRQVAKHTAHDAADRHRAALTERTCKVVPLTDGMAGLWVVHTADKIQQMWVVIQAMSDLSKRGTPPPSASTTHPTAPHPTATPSNATPSSATLPGEHPSSERHISERLGVTTTDDMASLDDAASTERLDTAPADDSTLGKHPTRTTSNRAAATEQAPATAAAHNVPSQQAAATSAHHDVPTEQAATTRADHGLLRERAYAAATDHNASSTHRATATADDTASSERPAGNPAGTTPGDPDRDQRTAEQRRADVITDLFAHMLHNGLDWLGRRLPDRHRRRPHIEVLTPITTLLDMDDNPCELTGYGPIPADMARRIATDGTWRRLLTDPTNGTVLEAANTRHDPGTVVTETLLARHPVCAWPGCNRTSRECDRDHATPFAQSGQTTLAGLVPYCEYHHVIKDNPAWKWSTTTTPDGSVTLTSPTGHRYTTVPPAQGPITPTHPTAPTPAATPAATAAATPTHPAHSPTAQAHGHTAKAHRSTLRSRPPTPGLGDEHPGGPPTKQQTQSTPPNTRRPAADPPLF
ncbi:DUF222 domain-containing protein [Kribbella sp. NPDC054772]